MPRIYGAVYQPYTYDELAKPLQEMTQAHQKVQEDYDNNMLVVDALRQRAASELETNPNSKWANNIIDYADRLESYAADLASNGLTRDTSMNLLNMKRGYGTTVSPVLMAMQREKELQSIIDKNAGTRMVFGTMPTIDQIIANPNASMTSYSGETAYGLAKEAAAALAGRNTEIIPPRNINAWMYAYGKKQGFTNKEISAMLQNDPEFANMFGYIRQQMGYTSDETLDAEQQNRLNNEILAGALAGFNKYDVDMKYGTRADYMNPLDRQLKQLQINKLQGDDDGSGGGFGTGGRRLTQELTQAAVADKQNKLNGMIDKIINIKDQVNAGANFNDLINSDMKGLTYKDFLDMKGLTYTTDTYTNEFEPSYSHEYIDQVFDKNGKKLSQEQMKQLKDEYENTGTVAQLFKQYNLEPTEDNLQYLAEMVSIDLGSNVVQQKYWTDNDDHTRKTQMQQYVYDMAKSYEGKLGKSRLKTEDGQPYKVSENDWHATNKHSNAFDIIVDPNSEHTLAFATNGTLLIPESDFFDSSSMIPDALYRLQVYNRQYAERSNYIKQQLKENLADVDVNPIQHKDKYVEKMKKQAEASGLTNDQFEEWKDYLESLTENQQRNLVKQFYINEAYNELNERNGSLADIAGNIYRTKDKIYHDLESQVAVTMPGDATTDRTVYDELTGRK